jgi:hypothetical protein
MFENCCLVVHRSEVSQLIKQISIIKVGSDNQRN